MGDEGVPRMAVANCFDSILDVGADWPVLPRRVADPIDPELLLDLEFSEVGRDPRFLPGWYILPSIVGGLLVLTALIV